MKIWKMSGAGNTFLVVDARQRQLDMAQAAILLCKAYGTDGFMAVTAAENQDFRLHYYNSDGSRGELCGNGSRCICRFAYELGIAGAEMEFLTDAGPVRGACLGGNQVWVQLPPPGVAKLDFAEGIDYVEVGCPHALREHTGELGAHLKEEMRALRQDPRFPKGANVNFWDLEEEGGTVRLLTFERGVEDFTLACGTGSGSTAAVLTLRGLTSAHPVCLSMPGGRLKVEVEQNGEAVTGLWLIGDTNMVADGILTDEDLDII